MFTSPIRKILLFCACAVLLCGISLYLYQKNKPPLEPLKIYKAPTWDLRTEKKTSTQQPESVAAPADTPSVAGSESMTPEPTPDTEPLKVSSEPPVPDFVDDIPMKADPTLTTLEETTAWVTEQLEKLTLSFTEKYPELTTISQMTKEEYLEKYPTDEEQEALLQWSQMVSGEMFEALREVFDNVPAIYLEASIDYLREHYTELWGPEAAEAAVNHFRSGIGL